MADFIPATPCGTTATSDLTSAGGDFSLETPGVSAVWAAEREGGFAGGSGGFWKEKAKARTGACSRHAPKGRVYLLPGRVEEAGTGVPISVGVGTVDGSTVGLGRVRNGWMPNSTSLSLPLP